MGGGLSGAIYQRFDLDPIPQFRCESIFNSSDAGKRILHTHSPQLFAVENIWEATRCIARAYLSAITVFVEAAERHGEQVLNLCAVSAKFSMQVDFSIRVSTFASINYAGCF